jgi:hypothetical protein
MPIRTAGQSTTPVPASSSASRLPDVAGRPLTRPSAVGPSRLCRPHASRPLGRDPLEDFLTEVHHVEVLADGHDQVHVVLNQQDTGPPVGDHPLQYGPETFGLFLVQTRRRLVEQQQLDWSGQDRANSTRRRWPVDRSPTRRPARSDTPARLMASTAADSTRRRSLAGAVI